jgi:hypothetical protein
LTVKILASLIKQVTTTRLPAQYFSVLKYF